MSELVHGAREVIARMAAIGDAAGEAAARIVARGQVVVENEAKSGFTGSHAKGQPTTSEPGQPPDVVTGTLRRSIKSSKPEPVGQFGARGQVYPTAIYARIQELGGPTWNNGFLPPRPFMRPAHEKSKDRLEAIALEEWRGIYL